MPSIIVNKWIGGTSSIARKNSYRENKQNILYEKIKKGNRLSSYSKFYLYKDSIYEDIDINGDSNRWYWDKFFDRITPSDLRYYKIRTKFSNQKAKPEIVISRYDLMEID